MPYADKVKQREFQRIWIAAKRAAYFLDKVCVKCKSNSKLQIHHKDRSIKVTHRIWSWSWPRILKELEACEVLCHSCHVLEHWPLPPHGTATRYKRLSCRCIDCTYAASAAKRAYRERLRSHR